MAVITTPEDIVQGAYGFSKKNRVGAIATEETELMQVVVRSLRGLYAAAARVNPEFFAESAAVALASGKWARPETAESVFYIARNANTTGGTGSTGDEVAVVSREDRTAVAETMGAVYRFAQAYWTAGNAKDPTGGELEFWYAKRPDDPDDYTSPLDALWTEQFNQLLMLETALYLAQKDRRTDEMPALHQDRMTWLALFVAFLEHETSNERRRFQTARRIHLPDLLPMLAPAVPDVA